MFVEDKSLNPRATLKLQVLLKAALSSVIARSIRLKMKYVQPFRHPHDSLAALANRCGCSKPSTMGEGMHVELSEKLHHKHECTIQSPTVNTFLQVLASGVRQHILLACRDMLRAIPQEIRAFQDIAFDLKIMFKPRLKVTRSAQAQVEASQIFETCFR